MTNHSSQPQIHKIQRAILLAFFAVLLSLFYWGVVRSEAILARDDNPRLVEAELRLQRGRILDRNGVVLAQTVGPPDGLTRQYPLPTIGPAVGYYSFRHGTAGIEAGLDTILRGESGEAAAVFSQQLSREILHTPQVGHDVQITIDAGLQTIAETLMGEAQGALIVLEIDSGDILVMVSRHGYNPNLLDENFEALVADESAPLLNRAVQGQYQPGLVIQPFVLAAALENDYIQLDDPVQNPNRPIPVNGEVKRCQTTPPEEATWRDVLLHRCPGPMQDLANQLGLAGLDDIFLRFGLAAPLVLPLNTETPPLEPLEDPLQAGIGQDNLTVSPLQVAVALAALGNNGRLPTPQLVTAVADANGLMQPQPAAPSAGEAVTSRTSGEIRQLLNTGSTVSFAVSALSGPESRNGWYLALTPADVPQFAVVLVIESGEDLETVARIGQGIAAAVGQSLAE